MFDVQCSYVKMRRALVFDSGTAEAVLTGDYLPLTISGGMEGFCYKSVDKHAYDKLCRQYI